MHQQPFNYYKITFTPMQKGISPKGKKLIKLIAGAAISIISVITDRALPLGLDDFILSLFN